MTREQMLEQAAKRLLSATDAEWFGVFTGAVELGGPQCEEIVNARIHLRAALAASPSETAPGDPPREEGKLDIAGLRRLLKLVPLWDEVSSFNLHRRSFQVTVKANCVVTPEVCEATALFVAAARRVVPDLLAEIDRLRAPSPSTADDAATIAFHAAYRCVADHYAETSDDVLRETMRRLRALADFAAANGDAPQDSPNCPKCVAEGRPPHASALCPHHAPASSPRDDPRTHRCVNDGGDGYECQGCHEGEHVKATLAGARAEGFREGVEAAAKRCEEHADYLRRLAQSTTIYPEGKEADAVASDFCASLIRRVAAPTPEPERPAGSVRYGCACGWWGWIRADLFGPWECPKCERMNERTPPAPVEAQSGDATKETK